YSALNTDHYDNVYIAGRQTGDNSCIYLNIRGDGGNAGKVLVGGHSNDSDSFQEKTSSTVLTANKWYHVVTVLNYATNQLDIYINGVSEGASSVTFGSTSYVANGSP